MRIHGRFLLIFFCMIFSLPLFAQELELIDPDEWLPGKIDPSEDVRGVLGLEFGMTRDEVIAAMTGQGCTLAFEHTYTENNIVELDFDDFVYENVCGLKVCVNLTADTDKLDGIVFEMNYIDTETEELVKKIKESFIDNLGLSLLWEKEIEEQGLFGSIKKSKLSQYRRIVQTGETGRVLYGNFCYQVEERPYNYTFFFYWLMD